MSNFVKIITLLVATLCVPDQTRANVFLPPKIKFTLPDILKVNNPQLSPVMRISPIRILPILLSTATPMTTPSMVDFQTWNFTNPGVVAKDCFSAIGTPMVKVCQDKAGRDWDPAKLNTTTSTTWETCCALFEELDCYVKNANTFCPAQTRDAVAKYATKVAFYFHWAICQSVSFSDWKNSCDNATHYAKAQNHTSELDNNPDAKPSFVSLPQDDGPEKSCFNKLRTHTKVNLEQKCQDQALNKWDPTRRKFMESAIGESCCSIYDALDCIQKEATNVCTDTELYDMANYSKKSVVAFSNTICKTVPYDQRKALCTPNKAIGNATVPTIGTGRLKGGSQAVMPSLFAIFGAILLFARVY